MPVEGIPVTPPIPAGVPVFEYVPIIGNSDATAKLRVTYIAGLNTKHGSLGSDRGRLYATLSKVDATYTLDIYRAVTKQPSEKVLSGTAAALEQYFDLLSANGSGMSGRAWIASYSETNAKLILLPTFAVDEDVQIRSNAAAAMPSYDGAYGLALFHAKAMRTIMTQDLPVAVPHLFGGAGLAAFVPQGEGAELADITQLANVDALREAQAFLVKALSHDEREHVEEHAAVAELSRTRYVNAMKSVAEANVNDEKAAEQDEPGISVSTWERE